MFYQPAADTYGRRKRLLQHLRAELPDIVDNDTPFPLPAEDEVFMFGRNHMHIPFQRADGSTILLRASVEAVTAESQDSLIKRKQSEMATMKALRNIGLPVPEVYGSLICPDGYLCFALELMPGRATGSPITCPAFPSGKTLDDAQTGNLIYDLARFHIGLSSLSYPWSGMLQPDDDVGPFIINKGDTKYGKVPARFDSFRSRSQAALDARLEQASVPKAVLVWLECETLLCDPGFDDLEPGVHYIMHEEDKGDQYLVDDDGHLTAFLDWEGAFTTSKGDAFAGPPSLMRLGDFFSGGNDPTPEEQLLMSAYTRLGRPDLAACVRDGKKYQRFRLALSGGLRDDALVNIKALRGAVTGEAYDQGEDWDHWVQRKMVEFAGDERLQKVCSKV